VTALARLTLGVAALALLAPRASRAEAPKPKETMNLAVVLLSDARLPKGEAIERAFAAYAIKGQTLRYRPQKPEKGADGKGEAITVELDGRYAIVALMPAPVPNREADEAARYSISALADKWKLPPHKAHLVVTAKASGNVVDGLSSFTSLLAAVAEASSAVGIYCGGAGATHDPKFFRELAADRAVYPSRMMLWTGVSIAREGERYSLLSLGMAQFHLPDLLLIVPPARTDDALPFMIDLLGMVVRDGKAMPEGDTVGRTATEKLPVHYVTSPVDPKTKVWRVEMK
jgi:hypothetical protein